MEKFNYYVCYLMTQEVSYICSQHIKLNRTINNMKDLEVIKNMIAEDNDTKKDNIQILNIMRFPI